MRSRIFSVPREQEATCFELGDGVELGDEPVDLKVVEFVVPAGSENSETGAVFATFAMDDRAGVNPAKTSAGQLIQF